MASWRTEPERLTDRWLSFRQTSPAWPPLWHNAGEPIPSQESGRFHREGDGYCQYLSLVPIGAWAECARYFSVRSTEQASSIRRNLWAIYVEERDIANLASFDLYDAAGLDPRIAVGDHADSQAIADELRAAGYRGLLSPSAALPGITNLTVFGERYEQIVVNEDPWAWRNPDSDVWLPCSPVVRQGPVPDELTTATCFPGSPHAGYRAWLTERGLPAPASGP